MNSIHIVFGVYSSDDIRNLSVCEVTSTSSCGLGTLSDERMGIIEKNVECLTCYKKFPQCQGHFGHIELGTAIFNPVFLTSMRDWNNVVCRNCHEVVLDEEWFEISLEDDEMNDEEIDVVKRFLTACKKIKRCNRCEEVLQTNKKKNGDPEPLEFANRMNSIPPFVFDHLNIDTSLFHPKNFVLECIIVVPPCVRPYLLLNGEKCRDDITELYSDIIKSKHKGDVPNIIKRVEMLMLNADEKVRYSESKRPIKSIISRIKGKHGRIRSNIMGKRCEQTARGVIGPDPTLKFEEVGLPEYISKTLTIPEKVTDFNLHYLQRLVLRGYVNRIITGEGKEIMLSDLFELKKRVLVGDKIYKQISPEKPWSVIYVRTEQEAQLLSKSLTLSDIVVDRFNRPRIDGPFYRRSLNVGDMVYRHLMDGDVVVVNRQPTLHKPSMEGLYVRVIEGSVIKINLAITKPFNADFDGDEMNIHVPQTVQARVEVEQMTPRHNFISAQNNQPCMAVVQDGLLGIYKLSNLVTSMGKDVFFNGCMELSEQGGDIESHLQRFSRYNTTDHIYSGRSLLSLIFPNDFNYNHHELVIVDGIIVRGVITKANVASSKKSLQNIVMKLYGHEKLCTLFDNLQALGVFYVQNFGFSIGLRDCFCTRNAKESIEKIIKEEVRKVSALNEIQDPLVREFKMVEQLERCKDKCMRVSKDNLLPNNCFSETISAGSKGDYFNLAQVTGLLGQQNVNGKRITYQLRGRSLVHFPFEENPELSIYAKGFVATSFSQGLDPRSFFFHAMSGRQGIVDTAIGTSKTGYIQRRLVKVLENTSIRYDGSARNEREDIVQFHYNYDRDVFNSQIPIPIQALVKKIKSSHK